MMQNSVIFPPGAEYQTLAESKLQTQMATCRHDMGVTHSPWGAAVVMSVTHMAGHAGEVTEISPVAD